MKTFDKPLAKYWLHGEFLTINQNRMGKSLGNFITLQNLIKEGYSPSSFRYLVLNSHYRSHLDFSLESLQAADKGLHNLKNNLDSLKNFRSKQKNKLDKNLIKKFEKEFKNAVNDDLNTPKALAAIQELLKSTNQLGLKNKLNTQTAKQAYKAIIAANKVLGLNLELGKIPQNIIVLAKKRELLRANKQFIQSDALRKEIEALGYIIEDTPNGPSIWHLH